LFVVFAIQFAIPTTTIRLATTWIYLALALIILAVRRTSLRTLIRTTPEVASEYRRGATRSVG
jgi:hypothetical protein